MLAPSRAALQRSLVRLRRRGQPVGVVELAQRLLALRAPLEPGLARRIVAEALGRQASALPERLEAGELRPAEEVAVADVCIGDARFAVVDLETTGLSVDRCHILEIGAVRVSGLERTDRFATLVRPPGRISRSITALTGIDDAAVADAPSPLRALRSFRSWLERGAPAPFVAHNAQFDARFVARAFRDRELPPYRAPVVCTRRLARRLLPRLGRYGLDSLCAHLGISNPGRHRGPGDAEATARSLIELLELARVSAGIRTVGELLDFQESPLPRRRPRRRPLS
jgi:DNA polymerase-3 subunit epsilon